MVFESISSFCMCSRMLLGETSITNLGTDDRNHESGLKKTDILEKKKLIRFPTYEHKNINPIHEQRFGTIGINNVNFSFFT